MSYSLLHPLQVEEPCLHGLAPSVVAKPNLICTECNYWSTSPENTQILQLVAQNNDKNGCFLSKCILSNVGRGKQAHDRSVQSRSPLAPSLYWSNYITIMPRHQKWRIWLRILKLLLDQESNLLKQALSFTLWLSYLPFLCSFWTESPFPWCSKLYP